MSADRDTSRKFTFHHLEIFLENIHLGYGYIRGTKGEDGASLDCFWGGRKSAKTVFIFSKFRKGGREFDETKVMLGFKKLEHAIESWMQKYSRSRLRIDGLWTLKQFQQELKTRWRKS